MVSWKQKDGEMILKGLRSNEKQVSDQNSQWERKTVEGLETKFRTAT